MPIMKWIAKMIFLWIAALMLAAFPAFAEEGTDDAEQMPVETEQSEPDVRFARELSSRYAEYGDQITLNYTIYNDSLLPLENVRIEDALVGEVGRMDKIEPGERKTVSVRIRVTQGCSSRPTLYYDYAGQTYSEERSSESVSLADVNLHVELDADKTNVSPGEIVTLRLRLVNQGNVNLYSLRGSEPALGEMGSLVSTLAPGEEYTVVRTVQMKSTGTFQFTVEGSSATGGSVSVQSNERSILVTPVAAEIQLELKAEADQTELYGPGEVTFSLYVSNDCSLELRNVVLSEETRGEIRQLAFVPTGEMPVISQKYTVTESGEYRFMAQVVDSVGDQLTVYSEPISITVLKQKETAESESLPSQEDIQPEQTKIPVLDGSPYRMAEDSATFEKLMLGAVAVLLSMLCAWYLAEKFKRWNARRRRIRRRRQRKKNRNATRKK